MIIGFICKCLCGNSCLFSVRS